MTATTWAIVIASGKDEMLNAETCTAFLNVNNRPVLSYSLTALEKCPDVEGVVIVAPKDRLEQVVSVIQLYGCHKVRKVVPGGSSEYVSFNNAMKYVDDDVGQLMVLEASRPGLHGDELSQLAKHGKKHGAVMAGQAIDEATALVAKNGVIEKQPAAGTAWRYGMPMVVKRDVLDKAAASLKRKKKNARSMEEALTLGGQKFRLVDVQHFPVKIDGVRDLEAASFHLSAF